MRVYLDLCCLSRPFDDQTKMKIVLESEAVIEILRQCRENILDLVTSDFITYKIHKTVDENKRRSVFEFVSIANEIISASEEIKLYAQQLEKKGFKPLDAVHIAYGEKSNIDVFLTTDDKLLKKYQRENADSKMKINNPLSWLMRKESEHENNE